MAVDDAAMPLNYDTTEDVEPMDEAMKAEMMLLEQENREIFDEYNSMIAELR